MRWESYHMTRDIKTKDLERSKVGKEASGHGKINQGFGQCGGKVREKQSTHHGELHIPKPRKIRLKLLVRM